uniref:Uncharacterized protein n=1 Tax=Arundo donax TaxID=35708 RepID=A0A0A9EFU8_ARUDO
MRFKRLGSGDRSLVPAASEYY